MNVNVLSTSALAKIDPDLNKLLEQEEQRQEDYLSLIPSENYTHPAIREAIGSVCTNKYSEGYAGRRYYNGNRYIDQIELLAIERTKRLFGGRYANVQPYSGSPANLAVYFALLEPGDTVMGLELSHGGHLTHGAKVSFSGKWFHQVPIRVLADQSEDIDYDQVLKQAKREKPKMIIAGVTAYPKELDYRRLSEIAKEVGAYLVADISHTNGLVLAGIHQHPLEVGADIITSTTHKLLRGPRGAVIVTNDAELAKKVDKAIMPGLQGGPHNHQTAAIAAAMNLASMGEYQDYVQDVYTNAQHFAKELVSHGFRLVTGGTENHLLVVNLLDLELDGRKAADLLEEAGLVVNANTIPNDPNPPLRPSGIRIGTPAITTRGLGTAEVSQIAMIMKSVLIDQEQPSQFKAQILELARQFPVEK